MLRILLPPNLPDAARRNAIAIRLHLDVDQDIATEWIPALASIQRWTGATKPPQIMQLSCTQLKELIDLLDGQTVFFSNSRNPQAFGWSGKRLVGVSDYLEEAKVQLTPSISNTRSNTVTAPSNRLRTGSDESVHSGDRSTGAGILDGSEHFLTITLPNREHPAYSRMSELVRSQGFSLEPANRKWWLRDRHKVLNFLASYRSQLIDEWKVNPTENFVRNTAHVRAAEIVGSVEEDRGGFNLTLALRAGQTDEGSVRLAVATGRGYVENGGKVFLIEKKKLERLATAQKSLTNNPQAGLEIRQTLKIRSARIPEAQAILDELSPAFQPPPAWRARGEALRDIANMESAPIPAALRDSLRPYQRLGVAWLWYLLNHDLGGILADEMGLGKTPQALALIAAMRARPPRNMGMKPHLAVVPASLLENWRREAARFTPELRVLLHHGGSRSDSEAGWAGFDLIITSYGTLTRDRALFERVEFGCVLADEAQHLKNRRAQHARALRALRAEGRFLLTGTPMENSLEDLRSLFEFLMPGFLEPLPPGLKKEDRVWHDERLRVRTAPYILRRTKTSVAPELPPKIEQVVWCEMGATQMGLYRKLQEEGERELLDMETSGAGDASLRFAMLTQLLRLRQTCCDPRLVAMKKNGDDTKQADLAASSPPEYEESAKLDALRELIDEALDDGHRVLVFSQFTSLLALIRTEFDGKGLPYCYIDGSMSPGARQSEVDRFQASNDVPVFLLSLKAGGTGLNLTGADVVIHFDPWWNPAAEAQATDRAHRIGQTKTVTSYKLICSGSVEERVLALQEDKRKILSQVFEASDASSAKLSLKDLRDLMT